MDTDEMNVCADGQQQDETPDEERDVRRET